jgi:cobalt-zinc-cadmium efflux system outer membrane protein
MCSKGIKEMAQTFCWPLRGVLAALAGLLVGCATVNPAPDYRRAAEHVQRATAVKMVYDPDGEQAVANRIDVLLAGGLTAQEVPELALLNNPELQAAFRDIGIARAELVQAGLLSNPSLAVAFRLPAGGGLTAIDLDLAQNIADLWLIPVRKKVAERGLDRTILEVVRRATELAAKARSDYYAALGADERLRISRENLDITRKTLELTKFRRQAGAGSELDVNLARGVVLEGQLHVDQARLAAAEARRTLATTLGLVSDAQALVLADGLPDPPDYLLSLERLVGAALAERTDVQALRNAVRAAKERLILEHRQVFPTVEIGLSLERDARGPTHDRDILADTARSSIAAGRLTAPEIEPRSARDADQDLTLGPGLALELPVFDQNQAQIARARYEFERAERLLRGLERTVYQDVHGAVDQAQTAWRIATFYRDDVLPQAQKSLDMSHESYHAGKASILSVLDAERTFLAAWEGYAVALQESAAATPRLERVVGLPLREIIRAGGGDERPVTTQPARSQSGGAD